MDCYNKLFLIVILFLLVIPITFSFSTTETDYLFWDDGDTHSYLGGTPSSNSDDQALSDNTWTIGAAGEFQYEDSGQKIDDLSMFANGDGTERMDALDLGAVYTGVVFQMTCYDDGDNDAYILTPRAKDASTYVGQIGIKTGTSANNYCYYTTETNWQDGGVARVSGWVNFTIEIAPSASYVVLYANNQIMYNDTTSPTGLRYIYIYDSDETPMNLYCDSMMIWNGTLQDIPEDAPPAGDSTPPTIDSTSINNTAPKYNEDVQFSGNCSDETGISSQWISHNISTFKNVTSINHSSGTSNNFSINLTNTLTRGDVVKFQMTCNDTSGNEIQSSDVLYTVADTMGKISIGLNISSIRINDVVNVSGNITDLDNDLDDCMILHNQSGSMTNSTFQGINCSDTVTITLAKGGVINFTTWYNDTDNNIVQNSTLVTISNTEVPTPTNIIWKTTGGFTSGTRTYNEILDWVNATCTTDADSDFASCNLTVTDPDGSKVVNNGSMTSLGDNIYSYTIDTTLNKAGTWTLTVGATDDSSVSIASTTISVVTQNLSTTDGWYGYTENKILTEDEIDDLVDYDYTMFELTINASRIQSDWKQLLNSTNHSNDKSVRVGLNIILDFDYSLDSDKNNFYSNISSNFSDLITDPYEDTILYISLELANKSDYTDGDMYGVLNNASKNITLKTDNTFVIYSKNYLSAELDSSYIQNTTMNHIIANNHFDWIYTENGLMRNTTSLNRIYDINGTLQSDIRDYWNDIIDILRGLPVPTTTVGNQSVIEVDNGDFLVFNQYDYDRLIYNNFSNVSDILGKDLWDYTNKIYVHSNTNGTGDINVSAYSATIVFAEDFDHIEGTYTLYKATSSGRETFNYTDDTNDGNWILDNDADEIKIELFDPHYNINSFVTYYGWFNASYINNWSVYDVVVFDDENNHSLIPIMNNATNTDFYCYISVADFDNTEAWQSSKETEVDNCIDLHQNSEKVHIFLDGLDTGVGGTNFSVRFKELADYVKITKDRKVGLNTYTAYEDFCSHSTPDGFCMKESCVRRWNGASAASPDNYTWENWDLELNKSEWYNSHNVQVLCQAFDNRTKDTFEPLNWTIVQDTYFAALVLGYTDFYISQPDFNYAHTLYLYDVGTNLAQSYSTDDNETYYRRYSEGIVYYNTSSNKGWIDDGKETDVDVCFKLYDNSDGAGDEERDFEFRVNNVTNTDDYQYIIDAEDITAGVWQWYCTRLNETHESPYGSYKIEASTTNGGQVADGIYIGWENVNKQGRHSWYSDTAGNPVWNAYAIDQNWEVKVKVNQTKKASVDTFEEGITQTNITFDNSEFYRYETVNITLSSNNPFDIEVWSEEVTIDSGFANVTYANSRIYPMNTSDCLTTDPNWNSTTISGDTHKACFKDNADGTISVRFATPRLSTQLYQVNFLNSLPVVLISSPTESQEFSSVPIPINYTVADGDLDTISQVNVYVNGTLNQTTTINTTLNVSNGVYKLDISAYDGKDWGLNTTISSFTLDISVSKGSVETSFTSGAEAGADIFAAESSLMAKDLCESSAGFIWYNDMCYECSGKIIEQDGEVLCLSCNEGYVLDGNKCVPAKTYGVKKQSFIDKFFNETFENPLFAFIIIATGGFVVFQILTTKGVINKIVKKR